jgi:hypothetical protein
LKTDSSSPNFTDCGVAAGPKIDEEEAAEEGAMEVGVGAGVESEKEIFLAKGVWPGGARADRGGVEIVE